MMHTNINSLDRDLCEGLVELCLTGIFQKSRDIIRVTDVLLKHIRSDINSQEGIFVLEKGERNVTALKTSHVLFGCLKQIPQLQQKSIWN